MAERDDWTLVHLVRQQAAALGDKVFLTSEQGVSLTYAGLDRRSDDLAAALVRLGVEPGDRVLALMRNSAEFVVAVFAIAKAGAIMVPVNVELRGDFLQHQLRNATPRVVLADLALLPAFEGVDAADSPPEQLVVVGGDVPEQVPATFARAARMTFAGLEALGEGRAPPDLAPKRGDTAFILYTSGTTGPSKGALIPHGQGYLMGLAGVKALRMTADDVFYVCMPLFHGNALFLQMLGTMLVGGSLHVVVRFSPNRWLDEVIACGATLTNALGVMPEFLHNTKPTERDRAHRVRAMLAVPIGRDWGHAFRDRFGFAIAQGFGMTECGLPIFGSIDDDLVPGRAGPVDTEYFDLVVADPETDDPLPAGAVGGILMRPKVSGIFSSGYFRMPDRTVEAWRNLWFHSGDAARFDDDGNLYFIDRIKDCIRRRGENISAFEVEQVVNRHPAIAECAVVGVRVAGAGGEDEVKAVIVAAEGADLDPVALLDWCAERMPRFAVPRFVEQVPALEKTQTGKLRKQPLRDAGVTPATWDRESVGYVLARR